MLPRPPSPLTKSTSWEERIGFEKCKAFVNFIKELQEGISPALVPPPHKIKKETDERARKSLSLGWLGQFAVCCIIKSTILTYVSDMTQSSFPKPHQVVLLPKPYRIVLFTSLGMFTATWPHGNTPCKVYFQNIFPFTATVSHFKFCDQLREQIFFLVMRPFQSHFSSPWLWVTWSLI